MSTNGKNRCEFVFSDADIVLLDKKKEELGYTSRSSTVKFLIHNANINQSQNNGVLWLCGGLACITGATGLMVVWLSMT